MNKTITTPSDFAQARAEIADLLRVAQGCIINDNTPPGTFDDLRKISGRMHHLLIRYLAALASDWRVKR